MTESPISPQPALNEQCAFCPLQEGFAYKGGVECVAVRRTDRGAWGVFVCGGFVSDHRTHDGARLAARNHARVEYVARTEPLEAD